MPYHAAKNVVEGGVWVVKATYVVVAFHLIGRGEDFNLGLVRTERRPLGPVTSQFTQEGTWTRSEPMADGRRVQ